MLFLTQEEIEKLTGYKTPARQQAFLKFKKINFVVSGSGEIIVLRKAIETTLMPYISEEENRTTPNFPAIPHG